MLYSICIGPTLCSNLPDDLIGPPVVCVVTFIAVLANFIIAGKCDDLLEEWMLADSSKFISTCNSGSSCVYVVRERCKLVAFLAVSLGIRMYFFSHFFFWHNLGLVRLTQALAQDFSHLISSRPNLLGLCSGQYPRDLCDTKHY